MSAADLEVLRRMWEEMGHSGQSRVDAAAAERWWHPEITYIEDPRWPGSGAYRGRDEVMAVWNGYLDVLGSADFTVEDLIDAGDSIVALVQITGVSKGADIPFEHLWAYVCRIREGQLVYQRAYWEPDEALAAAGLDSSESP